MTDFVRLGQRAAYYELLSVRRELSAEDREFYRQMGEKFRQMQSDALERTRPVNALAIVAAVKQEPEYSEWADPAPVFPHANVLRQRLNTSQRPGMEGDVWTGVKNAAILTVLLGFCAFLAYKLWSVL